MDFTGFFLELEVNRGGLLLCTYGVIECSGIVIVIDTLCNKFLLL